MADTSRQFLVTPPANGSSNNIQIYNTPLGPSVVKRILITWPPGCSGLVPVQIMAGEQAAFPGQPGTFFVFDGFTYPFEVTGQITTGQWSVATYNLDALPHVIQIVYEFDFLNGSSQQGAPLPISL